MTKRQFCPLCEVLVVGEEKPSPPFLCLQFPSIPRNSSIHWTRLPPQFPPGQNKKSAFAACHPIGFLSDLLGRTLAK